ncbi:MAG TPA: methylmalonyl-CoA epimerase [Candidatus Acidoferrum sp.]|nr:methylmalonyl-CoA epimerase [Candidatus Acidoferrum sp.]
MEIDHVGILVADLDQAVRFHVETLGFTESFREIVADQNVEIAGLCAGDSYVELLRPLIHDSPLTRYLGQARTKLHHIAYRVSDVRAALAEYASRGLVAIDETPRRGAQDSLVAFLHPKSTNDVLIELCQRDGEAQRPF